MTARAPLHPAWRRYRATWRFGGIAFVAGPLVMGLAALLPEWLYGPLFLTWG